MKASSIHFYSNRGFTLVEVVVALTLFSLSLALLYSGLDMSAQNRGASERHVERNENLRLADAFIRRQLMQAIPLAVLNGNSLQLLFEGRNDKLTFVSKLPAHRGGGGLHLLRLELAQENGRSDLVLRYRPIVDLADSNSDLADKELKTQVLFSNVSNLELRYFGNEDSDDAFDWNNEWTGASKLPALIDLQITPDNETFYWPNMFVPMRNQLSGIPSQYTLSGLEIQTGA